MRIALTITAVLTAGLMSGCYCGPVAPGGCGACVSPFNGLAQFRKSLVCGSGCGEEYLGEWHSTPPDACDPCSGGQFVGGAVPCAPCWYPGKGLLTFLQYTGQRFCEYCNCVASQCTCGAYCGPGIGCGDAGCGGSCGAAVVQSGGTVINSGAGCAGCSSSGVPAAAPIGSTTGESVVEQQHYVAPVQRTAARNRPASPRQIRNSLYR